MKNTLVEALMNTSSRKHNPECDLCAGATVESGKDTLLHGTSSYYIVDNGNTEYWKDDVCYHYSRRISLIYNWCGPISDLMKIYLKALLMIHITERMLIPKSEIMTAKTMSAYPDHYHIHAYIAPIIPYTLEVTPE